MLQWGSRPLQDGAVTLYPAADVDGTSVALTRAGGSLLLTHSTPGDINSKYDIISNKKCNFKKYNGGCGLQFFETLYYCTVVHYNNFYIYSKTDFWANYIMSLWRKSKLHTGIYQRTICILVTSFVRHMPITSGTNPYCWPLLSCFRDTGPTESQWTSLTTERLGVWADTTSALSPGRQSFEKKIHNFEHPTAAEIDG